MREPRTHRFSFLRIPHPATGFPVSPGMDGLYIPGGSRLLVVLATQPGLPGWKYKKYLWGIIGRWHFIVGLY